MHLSELGREALFIREGVRYKAYQDTKGIWTNGVGHTGPDVYEGQLVSREQVEEWFANDKKWAEAAINDNVIVPLTQNQFDALVSFVFNIGGTAFKKSTLLRKLNTGDYAGAIAQFDRWVIPKEITRRRMDEKKQFSTPYP